jgi:hypothetical protein
VVSDLWLRLIALWHDAGLAIRPGVDLASIRTFEARYCVTLPDDLRAYWMAVDGMGDDLDPGLNRFWPIGMVRPVSDELSDIHSDRWAYRGCYVFADHCIWCFGWAVRLGSHSTALSGPVFQVTGGDPPGRQVAASFTAFVKMYLADPTSVL